MKRRDSIQVQRSPLATFAAGIAIAVGSAHAQGTASPPTRGRILFLRCASCHDISDRASLKTGPNLRGVVGRKAGGLPDYAYSPAMKAANFVWTPAMLDRWIARPDAVVPGTIMAFEGMASEADRQALIAYLAKPNP